MVASWVLSHTSKGLLKELSLGRKNGGREILGEKVENTGGKCKSSFFFVNIGRKTRETLENLSGDSMSVGFGIFGNACEKIMWGSMFFKTNVHF